MLPEVEELLTKLRETREQFLQLLQDLTEEELGKRPTPEEWSAKDLLLHLPATEKHFREQAQRLCVEDRPQIIRFPVDDWNPARTAAGVPLENGRELRSKMDAVRKELVDFINTLGPEQVNRTGSHPRWGELTVLQFLKSIYRHERVHTEQLQKVREQLEKR